MTEIELKLSEVYIFCRKKKKEENENSQDEEFKEQITEMITNSNIPDLSKRIADIFNNN